MSDSYAAAGVDLGQSDAAVAAIVARLARIELGRPSRSVLRGGHYASVLRVTDELGVALTTDGVGSKLVVAEQADRLETVGIDCVAMNVNDLICVGAEPIAMLDYLAVETADPERVGRIAEGLRVGAQAAGIEIPGGELAVLPELIRGHPSPRGFDLCGAAFGTVALDAIVTGDEIAVGDALIGVPSTGLHSNGYTLARRALLGDGGLRLEDRPGELDGASVADALLEPTAIYVRAVLELLRSGVPVHGLAHITGGGLDNLKRLHDGVGYRLEDALPVPAIFALVQRLGSVPDEEMWRVFNMGCGFIAVVPSGAVEEAAAVLAAHHPGARRIGSVVAG
jgi:phosphoribosylformylglycinamidine cyclo-ligase